MLEEEQNYNFSPISDSLAEALLQDLRAGREQSIVLINRRGYATFAVCLDCGEAAKCPNCSVTLTYHKANGYLMCHYCGYTRPASTPLRPLWLDPYADLRHRHPAGGGFDRETAALGADFADGYRYPPPPRYAYEEKIREV